MVMNYEFVIKIILRMCGSLNCDRGLYVSSLFNGIYNQKYIIVRATRNIMYYVYSYMQMKLLKGALLSERNTDIVA